LKAESLFHIKSNKAQSLLPFIGQTFMMRPEKPRTVFLFIINA